MDPITDHVHSGGVGFEKPVNFFAHVLAAHHDAIGVLGEPPLDLRDGTVQRTR